MLFFEVKAWSKTNPGSKSNGPRLNSVTLQFAEECTSCGDVLDIESKKCTDATRCANKVRMLFGEIEHLSLKVFANSPCVVGEIVFFDSLVLRYCKACPHWITEEGVMVSHWSHHPCLVSVVETT